MENNSDKIQSALWRALLYIQNNINEKISLEMLSEVAGLSPFHFHRLFKKFTGETVNGYIKRIQMENAAFRLRIKDDQVIDVALDSGYYTHETFTRAFKKHFNMNPTKYRKNQQVQFSDKYITSIKKVYFHERRCIFKRYTGPYEKSGIPTDQNSLWMQLLGSLPKEHRNIDKLEFFGISHDDPSITSEKNIRYDACVALPNDVKLNNTNLVLHPGIYIKAKHSGPFETLAESYFYLFDSWIKEYNITIDYIHPPFEKFILKRNEGIYEVDNIKIFISINE